MLEGEITGTIIQRQYNDVPRKYQNISGRLLRLVQGSGDRVRAAAALPDLSALLVELSQPTYSINTVGKMLIDKKPDGTRSPNLADAVMICYQPGRRWMETWLKLV